MSITMSHVVARLSSPRWLGNKLRNSARNLIDSLTPFTPTVIAREVAGERCNFFLGNQVGKRWYGHPIDVCEEMRFVKTLIKPGDVALECGAHHGAHTILLSRWVGDEGRVIAVEPMPENAAIVRRNIDINGLTNVTLVEKLVGAHSARHTMVRQSNAAVTNKSGGNTMEIDGVTIDELASKYGIPSLITIDVEGFEYQVLEGGKTTLAIAKPALCIEVHTLRLSHYGKSFSDLWSLIDPDQYDVFIQRHDDEVPVAYNRDIPKDRVLLFFRPKEC